MERERDLPDADFVNKYATEEGQDHVGEGVDGVEVGPLCLGQVERWLLQEGLQRGGVVEAEVATHQEEAAASEHEPAPVGLANQEFLLGCRLLFQKGLLVI